jgi:hypothetical protein
LDDSIKQALIDRFRGYLDMAQDGEEPPDDPGETADLFSLLVEVAALRSEVRTESRLVKEALEAVPRRLRHTAGEPSHATTRTGPGADRDARSGAVGATAAAA